MKVLYRIYLAIVTILMMPAYAFASLICFGGLCYFSIMLNETFKEQWEDGLKDVVMPLIMMYYYGFRDGDLDGWYIWLEEQSEES